MTSQIFLAISTSSFTCQLLKTSTFNIPGQAHMAQFNHAASQSRARAVSYLDRPFRGSNRGRHLSRFSQLLRFTRHGAAKPDYLGPKWKVYTSCAWLSAWQLPLQARLHIVLPINSLIKDRSFWSTTFGYLQRGSFGGHTSSPRKLVQYKMNHTPIF